MNAGRIYPHLSECRFLTSCDQIPGTHFGMMAVLVGYGIPVSAALSIAILDRGLTMLFHFAVGGRYALKKIVS
jgi:hypothetical protein